MKLISNQQIKGKFDFYRSLKAHSNSIVIIAKLNRSEQYLISTSLHANPWINPVRS